MSQSSPKQIYRANRDVGRLARQMFDNLSRVVQGLGVLLNYCSQGSNKHDVLLLLPTTVLVCCSTKLVELHIVALYFPHYMTFIYLFLLFVQINVVLFFEVGNVMNQRIVGSLGETLVISRVFWSRRTYRLRFYVTKFTLNLD